LDTTLGWHWILDARDCEAAALSDVAHLERALLEVPDALGLTRVGTPQLFVSQSNQPGERTLAGLTLLSESHFSLHLRPGTGVLHADLFSCARFAPEAAREVLQRHFSFTRFSEQLLARGAPR
jgi:S-adenosylmethionine/arginine decarboxylase-like enzyme